MALSFQSLDIPDLDITLVTAGVPSRVLYLLDGNAALAALKAEWLERNPDLALAAIGYPDTETFNLDRRSLDYTPIPPPHWDGGVRRALDRPHGGSGAFLARLTDESVPRVEESLAVRPSQRALWGHSYGGLFALWAIMQNGHGFSVVHAASPSLWWGDYAFERQILTGEHRPQSVARVLLSMGDSEISRTGESLYSPARLAAVAESLGRDPGVDAAVNIFAGAGHGATFALSLERAIASS